MNNTDLTNLNLKQAGYNVAILTTSHELYESDQWLVAIHHDGERITFTLPTTLSHEKASELAGKIETAGIVNLTLWDASPEHIYNYDVYQQSYEDALKAHQEEQLGMQEAEFINEYILGGGDQWDAKTIWNQQQANQQ